MTSKIRTINSLNKKSITLGSFSKLLISTLSYAAMAQAEGVYISQFSTRTNTDTKSTNVSDIVVLSNGNLAVADTLNQKIKIFSTDGVLIHTFGGYGRNPGQFVGTMGLAEGRNNTLLVANRDNKRVDIFSFDGTYQATIDTSISINAVNSKPTGVAVDASTRNTFVADNYNNCIQVFDENGTYLSSFGGTRHDTQLLHNPVRVSVDSATQTVYVSNSGNHKITAFKTDGTFLRHFNEAGDTTRLHYPSTISKTNNSLYVADQANHRIQTFDANGQLIDSLGSYGNGPGQFNTITSFSIQESTGSLFITDANNHRIQQFFSPRLWTKAGEAIIPHDLTLAQPISIKENQKLIVNGHLSIRNTQLQRHSGSSIETAGDLIFTPTSSYHFIYDATNTTGSVSVNGTTYLNGKAFASNLNNIDLDTPHVILTAHQAINGKFEDISIQDCPFLKPQLSYDDNNVYLTVKWLKFADIVDDKNSIIPHIIDRYYDGISYESSLGKVIWAIENLKTSEAVKKALSNLSPKHSQQVTNAAVGNTSIISNGIRAQTVSHRTTQALSRSFTNFANVSLETAQKFSYLVQKGQQGITQFVQRLIHQPSSNTKETHPEFKAISVKHDLPQDIRAKLGSASVWIQQNGQFFKQKSTTQSAGVRSTTLGMSLGADYQLTNDTLIGIASGFAGNDYTLLNNEGSGNINSAFFGVYGSWNAPEPGWFVDGAVFIGRHRFDGERVIDLGSSLLRAEQKHRGREFAANTLVGYDIALADNYTLQPHVDAAFQYLREDSFRETGAPGVNLAIGKRQSRFLRVGGGLEVAKLFVDGERIFRPTLKIGFAQRRELGGENRTRAEFISLPGSNFTVVANKDKQNLLTFGTGLTAMLGKEMYVSASYNGEYNKKGHLHEALLRFGWVF